MSNPSEPLTLADFLLARIAEDEEAARTCGEVFPAPWDVADRGHSATVRADEPNFWVVAALDQEQESPGRWLGEHLEHIARHDPARVLAECAAKRAIVENADSERQRMAIYNRAHLAGDLTTPGDLRARLDANVRWGTLHNVLRAMAGVYRDHPDCDASWEVWP